MTSMNSLYHVVTLPIILYTRGIKSFCGNSDASFQMRDHILDLIQIKKYLGIMLWWMVDMRDYHRVHHYHYIRWHHHLCFVCGWWSRKRKWHKSGRFYRFWFFSSYPLYYVTQIGICGLILIWCGRRHNYSGVNSTSKKGLCIDLRNNIFDCDHKAVTYQMITLW